MLGMEILIGGDLSGFRQAMQDAEREVRLFGQRNEALFQRLGQVAVPAGVAFAGLSVTIGAAVKSFGDFEASLNQIKAVSGATAAEMDKMKQLSLELGAATQFSAKEAADGMGELAKAGMTSAQTMAAIPGVMALAAAGQLSVASAAEASSAALNSFKLPAEDAGRVADILAKAANLSAVSVGDLQNSMKYVAPVAAQASQSIEEVSTVLAIMGNAGIKGSEGGTAMRSALSSLLKPSDDAAERLHAMGISIQDTQGKMLPLTDILGQIGAATGKMTEVQRANTIATIFGQEAMSGIMAVMSQTPAQINAVAASFKNVDGAAAEMAGTMNQGINASFEQLKGSVDTLAATMGEQFAPALASVAAGAQNVVNGFTNMDPVTKTLTTAVLSASTAAAGLVSALGALGLALPLVEAGVAALGLTVSTALPIVGALSLAVAAFTVAAKASADATAAEAKAQAEASKARVDATVKAKAQADGLAHLVREHDALASKAQLSKAEQERLKVIQDQLKSDYPELAAAIQQAGDKHWATIDAVKAEIEAKKELVRMNRVIAQQAVASAQTELATANQKLEALRRQQEEERKSQGYGDKNARIGGLGVVAGEIAAQQRVVDSLNGRVMAAVHEWAKIKDIVEPEPSFSGSPNRGAVVAGAERKGKETDPLKEAERLAREVEQARQARIGAITKSRGDEAERFKAWGGGVAAEFAKLKGIINDVRAEGLDKFREGQEAIKAATHELIVLEGNLATARKKSTQDAFDKKVLDEIQAYVREQQKADEQAKKDADDKLKKEKDLADTRRKTLKEMQGELVALASDPSLERIANLAKSIFADEEKLEHWKDALGGIGEAFTKAGGGAEGLTAAVEGLGASAGTAGIFGAAVAGWTGQFYLLKAAVEQVKKPYDALVQSTKDFAAALDLIKEKQAAGLLTADEAKQQELSETQKKLEQALGDKQKLISGINNRNSVEQFATLFNPLNPFGLGDLANMLQYNNTINDLQQKLKALKAEAKATEKSDSLLSDWASQAEDLPGRIAEAAKAAAEAQKELDTGGRDDWGRKVSVEAERQVQIAKQKEQSAKRLNDLTERKLKLEKDLAKVNEDERKAIKDIEDEGIAVRAKTEAQDKSARIEKVKRDAAEKRADLTKEIAKTEKDITDANIEADQALSRMNIQYDERIKKLGDEVTKQNAIKDAMAGQLANLQAQYALALAMRALGGVVTSSTASSSPSGSSPSSGTDKSGGLAIGTRAPNQADGGKTTVVWGGTDKGWSKAATGGMVAGGIPGRDSVPMLTMPGELIVDNDTTRGLQAMIRSYRDGTLAAPPRMDLAGVGGPTVINLGGITVNGAPGMDARELADVVTRQINVQLRRAGLGR